jgi:hypothetical protein
MVVGAHQNSRGAHAYLGSDRGAWRAQRLDDLRVTPPAAPVQWTIGATLVSDDAFDIGVYGYYQANQVPTFTSSPPLSIVEGQTYTYNITTNDPEGDTVVITAQVKPTWLTFLDNGNGTASLTGVPGPTDAGLNPVTLRVDDSIAGFTDQSFSIDVTPIPPSVYWNERINIEVVGGITLAVGSQNSQQEARDDSPLTVSDGLANISFTVQVEE